MPDKMYVIVGPSGVGKDTVAIKVMSHFKSIKYSVSVTTREQRKGEVEGKDYFFITGDEFKKLVDEDGLIQYCLVHGNYYGTLKDDISSIQSKGNVPLMIVDVYGFDQIKGLYPYAHGIFIDPPSSAELERRLRSRKTDTDKVIENRLIAARSEIRKSLDQDYSLRVINDDLDECLEEVFSFIATH
jgi:guanylate kinase